MATRERHPVSPSPQTERLESPKEYGDPDPVVREYTERPDWVNNPGIVDDDDLCYLHPIPLHLRMNFVALANALDDQGLEYHDSGVEDYLELRGWADQAISSPSGSESIEQNIKLNAMHVAAAQKCWRSLESRQVLEAEGKGVKFAYSKKQSVEPEDQKANASTTSA
jgi:hypothetical protein